MSVKIVYTGSFYHWPVGDTFKKSKFADNVIVTTIPGLKIKKLETKESGSFPALFIGEGEIGIVFSHEDSNCYASWAVGTPEEVLTHLNVRLEEIVRLAGQENSQEVWQKEIAVRQDSVNRVKAIMGGGLCDEARINKEYAEWEENESKISDVGGDT